jgi:hypothetical protein
MMAHKECPHNGYHQPKQNAFLGAFLPRRKRNKSATFNDLEFGEGNNELGSLVSAKGKAQQLLFKFQFEMKAAGILGAARTRSQHVDIDWEQTCDFTDLAI